MAARRRSTSGRANVSRVPCRATVTSGGEWAVVPIGTSGRGLQWILEWPDRVMTPPGGPGRPPRRRSWPPAGGSSLVQSRKAWAAWWMSIPRPLMPRSAPLPGRRQQRGDRAGGTRGRPRPGPAPSRSGSTGSGSGSPGGGDHHAHAERGGVDDEVDARRRPPAARPAPTGPASATARSAGSGDRLTTTTVGRAGRRERPGDGPPGAARRRRPRSAARRRRCRRRRGARRRSPGRRCCRRGGSPPRREMQFTAPSASASGESSSRPSSTAALCGIVTDSPSSPSARMPPRARPAAPSGTSKAR